MLGKRRIIIRIFDIICIAISAVLSDYIVANFIRHDNKSKYPVDITMFIIFVCVAYLFSKAILYNRRRFFKRTFWEEVGVLLKVTVFLFVSIAALILLIGPNANYSRMAIGLFIVFWFVLSLTIRTVYKAYTKSMIKKGKAGAKNLLIVTTSENVDKVLLSLKKSNMWEYRFTGLVISDISEVGKSYQGIPVVADINTMYDYARREVVDEVFINVSGHRDDEAVINAIDEFESMGIIVDAAVQLYDVNFTNYTKIMSDFGGYYVVRYAPEAFDPYMMTAKRIMDICGSVIGLCVTAVVTVFLAPVLLIESPGPLFFSQIRIGKNGRKFKMYKFRSMYADAEQRKKELMEKNEMNGLMFKMKDDPRVTKVGKFIRKTSIDELPQFWNILKGDMSLVGTRPPTLDEFEKYEARHKRRLSIVPGLTGLWQASGRSDITDFEDVVNLDLEYIDNWSIWLDIKIILKTVGVVFKGKGAK